MKSLALAFIFAFSASAFAKNVQLKIQSKWDDGAKTEVLDTKVMAKLGKEWTIPFEGESDLMLRMVVKDKFKMPNGLLQKKGEAILLDGKIIKVNHGQEEIVSSPQIIARVGTEALITLEGENGEFLELRVQPDWY